MPAAGKTIMAPPPAIMNAVTLGESPECSPVISTWNAWYQSGPGTVTITKVDGPNIELDFSFPMGGKVSNKAMGSFTLKGHLKSPCYFIMP
jgi:hypothetical protein